MPFVRHVYDKAFDCIKFQLSIHFPLAQRCDVSLEHTAILDDDDLSVQDAVVCEESQRGQYVSVNIIYKDSE